MINDLDTLTREDLGFHWQANVFWKRLDSGFVRVCLARRRLDGSEFYDVVWSYPIDPSSWASIVASVSAPGETGTQYRDAVALHDGVLHEQTNDDLALPDE